MSFMSFVVEDNNFQSNQPNAAVYASYSFLSDFFSHPILSFAVFHQIPILCLCHLYNNHIFSLTRHIHSVSLCYET